MEKDGPARVLTLRRPGSGATVRRGSGRTRQQRRVNAVRPERSTAGASSSACGSSWWHGYGVVLTCLQTASSSRLQVAGGGVHA
ncbi:hypothetical protein E2562_005317 [Oryza meyeriana var. granulata]|uniref:Uncharacterized protein n=1 Tax=Oryza meyeriana var. granulata TaxID=110450 RepID=A0A6G1DEP5_9ORYZ|nr:hypothetical protein E2562_005317 [Oryza meyeriana var. granulata]